MAPAIRRVGQLFFPILPCLAGGLLSCNHDAPFAAEWYAPGSSPFSTTLPRRLTLSPGDDRTPGWLPGGSGILYSSERDDRTDHDRCLARRRPDGGTGVTYFCDTDPIMDDSTNVYESPAVAPDGRLLFFETIGRIGQQKGPVGGIMLGPAGDPVHATRLRQVPYTGPGGQQHSSVRLIRWLGPSLAVYLGERLFYEGSTFYPDTVITGVEIVRLDLSGPVPTFGSVPGTDYASSVSVSDEPNVVYYTLGGDSRVYRQDLGTGAVTPVYDFGPAGIARDAQVRGTLLVAVVGGSVLYQFEQANGWVQRDEGGTLHLVDLATGRATVFTGNEIVFGIHGVLFRHPELSPDGQRLVVEVSPYAPVHRGPQSDYTALNHRMDLWLFDAQAESPSRGPGPRGSWSGSAAQRSWPAAVTTTPLPPPHLGLIRPSRAGRYGN